MTHEENKQWLKEAVFSYTEGKFRDRFKGIILTETAMMKMGICFGFLLSHEELIDNFFDNLEWLNQHELIKITHDVQSKRTHKIPNKITELTDDGTFLGFGFIQLIPIQTAGVNGRGSRNIGPWNDCYCYRMNGGFLFHGSGQEVFAVELTSDNKPHWSIHT